MDPDSRIGPIERRHTTLHCNACDYHHPFPDGPADDPIYQHYCEHPDVLEKGQTDKKFDTRGRWIGSSDETPVWCPATETKDNEEALTCSPR